MPALVLVQQGIGNIAWAGTLFNWEAVLSLVQGIAMCMSI
jgi:hypothetical protein